MIHPDRRDEAPRSRIGDAIALGVGVAALVLGAWITSRFVVNVVNYEVIALPASADTTHAPFRQLVTVVPWVLVAGGALAMALFGRSRRSSGVSGVGRTGGLCGWPAWALAVIVGMWWIGPGPGFVSLCAFAIAAGCGLRAVARSALSRCADAAPSTATSIPDAERSPRRGDVDLACLIGLVVAIVLATAWQVHLQHVYWRHFALGFGDFGLFTQELEYCLPWKAVADRFVDTRMGYHAVFMFYALAPLYALFRSPVFLMVVGPLALNIAAVAFYGWARRRSGSAPIALALALTWLLLPSLSRMPFANQYGFQSVYLAVPWLAFAICFGLEGRWRASHVCLAGAILCEETVCGVAVGWGAYVALFHRDRRVTGIVIVAVSVAYLLICTQWLIPHFAARGTYTRVDLFGAVSPGVVFDRLFGRMRPALYVLAITAAVIPTALRGARLLVPIAPTLLLVLLIENPDYLNIKYWHQSTLLPLVFMAGAVGAIGQRTGVAGQRPSIAAWPRTIGLLTTALLMHHLLGATPLAQSYRIHLANPALRQADPRMAVVEFVRSRFDRTETRVVATEMLAAHFCDFYEIRKLSWRAEAPALPPADVLVIDHGDHRDAVVAAGNLRRFETWAQGHGYRLLDRVAGVSVWGIDAGE